MAPIASLVVKVSAQIAEFQKSFADTSRVIKKFGDEFEGVATKAAAVGSFLGSVAADIAGSLARGFGRAIRDAIQFSADFANAFTGLSSVARAFGTDTNLAKKAAQNLSADGLIPLKNSAGALKNLLSVGFGLPDAIKLLNVAKDSAAFGKQGFLSMGEAVERFTQGIKFNQSALTDSTGLGKNLSQVMKDAGLSLDAAGRASRDAGVRQAILNGFIKEGAAFTGDAAKLAQTYSGAVDGLKKSYGDLLVTWGSAITTNKTVAEGLSFVKEAFQKLNEFLADNRRGFLFVSDAVIAFVGVLAQSARVINFVQGVFNALDSVLVGVSRGILQSVKVIADSLLDLVKVAAALPGGSVALAGLAKELGSLQFISDKSGKAIDAFAERIAENDRRTVRWNTTLDGAAGSLDKLVTHLKDTRGQTVEVGESAERAGRSLTDGLAAGAAKAAKKLKEIRTEWLTLADLSKIGIRLPLFPSQLPPAPAVRRGLEGITTLPGDVLPIPPSLVVRPFRDAFTQLGRDLPGIIFGTLQHGGNIFGAIATNFAAQFTDTFNKAVDRVKKNLASGISDVLTTRQGVVGAVGLGLGTIVGGIAAGQAQGKAAGTALGAASGAAAGAAFGAAFAPATLGISIAVGAGIGALAGLIGGHLKDKKDQAALRQAQADAIKLFGSFDALKRKADELGVSIGNALTTKNPKEFQAAMERLNTAIDNQKKRWEGLQVAVEGVNKKAELFAGPFQKIVDAQKGILGDKQRSDLGSSELEQLKALDAKLAETGQRGQAEFERLGTFVAATFAGMVRESGDAIGAISALTPAFKVLQDGVTTFGLASSGTITQLLGMFGLVNDAVTGPILKSIAATGQIFAGLQQGGVLTADLFQTIGTDIGASFNDLAAKGGDVSKAMALSQPVLQRLWEGQQLYGKITDATTQALLTQAEEQGLVGDRMRGTNEKILEVLIAIADVFGAKIPDGFRRTTAAAKETATDVENAFRNIKIRPIDVTFNADLRWATGDFEVPRPRIEVPAFASGGIVRRPTLALIGESGPEAVVPLSGTDSASSVTPISGSSGVVFQPGAITINGDVDSDARAERIVADFSRIVRRGGRARSLARQSLGVEP